MGRIVSATTTRCNELMNGENASENLAGEIIGGVFGSLGGLCLLGIFGRRIYKACQRNGERQPLIANEAPHAGPPGGPALGPPG